MTRRARSYLALMRASVGRGVVLRLLALQLVVAVTEGLGLVLLVPVLQALGGSTSLSLPVVGPDLSVPVAFGGVTAVVALRAWGQWRVAVTAVDVRLRTVDDLRLGLVDDLYAADWAFLARQRRSHVVQRLTTEVERAQLALVLLLRIIVGSLVLLATLGVALVLSPAVGGLVVIGLVIVVALARRSVKTAVDLGEVMTQRSEGFGAALADSLASVRLMRAHDASVAWSDLVSDEAARVRDVRHTFVQKSAGVVAALGVVAVLAVLGLILVGRAAGMNAAELAALAVVATRLLTSAQSLVGSVQSFANEAPALDRLTEFRAEVREHREPGPRAATPSGPRTTDALVSLRDVTVRYAPDLDPVLHAVSLDVPRHGLVVVSGPSGAGKSTLLDVVLGLLRPDEGEVVVDGEPLDDLSGWRRRVGYVPQQTVLVPGTVWQNLVWSLPPGRRATEDDAWRALTVACLDDVVRALPGGLETPLNELAELSGGEQQRLSIARAVIREPDLLVLDEATSGLDPTTEALVLGRLLDGSRAVLLVTHRLPDHVHPDVSVRLDDGTLLEGR